MAVCVPVATDRPVTIGKTMTTIRYPPQGWLAPKRRHESVRRQARTRALQIRDGCADSFRITEFWTFTQLRDLANRQLTLFYGC